MRQAGWILGALMALAVPAQGVAQAKFDILNEALLPPGSSKWAKAFGTSFVYFPANRAFAVSANGMIAGGVGDVATIEEARSRALKQCTDAGGEGCAIYAENLEVVWPGHRKSPRAISPDSLITIEHSEIAADKRFLWYGPKVAHGVLVFGHGYGGESQDARMSEPPMWTRIFNNNGFDVVRFARDPGWDGDKDKVGAWLRTGLAELRKRGWKHITVAGQSRGAYNALQVLDTPGLADVVIAGAAGAYGYGPGNNRTLTDLWTMFGQAQSPHTRVAILQFDEDEFNPDPAARTTLINDRLKPHIGALLMIDRPDGITGHGGQYNPQFTSKFGGCLWRFVMEQTPPSAC